LGFRNKRRENTKSKKRKRIETQTKPAWREYDLGLESKKKGEKIKEKRRSNTNPPLSLSPLFFGFSAVDNIKYHRLLFLFLFFLSINVVS